MIKIFLLILIIACFFINERINKNKAKEEICIFLIWFSENHFYLCDKEKGLHFFKSESYGDKKYHLLELLELYKKETSE